MGDDNDRDNDQDDDGLQNNRLLVTPCRGHKSRDVGHME
mgnify:CR=1 FL=1